MNSHDIPGIPTPIVIMHRKNVPSSKVAHMEKLHRLQAEFETKLKEIGHQKVNYVDAHSKRVREIEKKLAKLHDEAETERLMSIAMGRMFKAIEQKAQENLDIVLRKLEEEEC